MIDTIIAIVLYVFLVLGVISFINMIDTLLFDGAISDGIECFLDKVAELYWYILDKIKERRNK
jgi:hypothetical protein